MDDRETVRDRTEPKPTGWTRVKTLLHEETFGIHPRLIALNAIDSFLPRNSARARARLFALAGFQIGAGTLLAGPPKINGGSALFSNLVIGEECAIAVDCVFDLEERITIGDRVTLGPGVMILTSTHELDIREHRAGPVQRSPVSIGSGAWLGARCTILPGVTVGAGSIVNPGALVNKDVAPNTRVNGIPAIQIEVLQGADPPTAAGSS
ncbi:MAG: acyltransferase [Pseudomonadota bacterium]